MKQEETLFLKILNAALHPNASALWRSFDTALLQSLEPEIFALARKHKILPPIYEFYCQQEIPTERSPKLISEISTYALSCYQMYGFTHYIQQLLEAAGIPFFLLKGKNLSKLYPKPEFRRFGDVDILINDDALFEKAQQLFIENGFESQKLLVDHHIELTYVRPERTYILELHRKAISSQDNKELDDSLNRLFGSLPLNKPLPPAIEALYLILHMLQHLLSSGFGVKLLCDWVVYLEHYTDNIDSNQLKSILEDLGLFVFAHTVTELCVQKLGLVSVPECFRQPLPDKKQKMALLAEDIFSAGEFGKTDTARMLILKNGSSFSGYFREFHFQMKRRYPALQHIIPLWPALWFLTGCYFLYNNRHLRHTSTREILQNARARRRLLDKLRIRL